MIANPFRGERVVRVGEGRYLARPTFGAIVSIEAEFGPLMDVVEELATDSGATLGLVSGALEAWIAAGGSPVSRQTIERSVVGSLVPAIEDARALALAYFDTKDPTPREGVPADRRQDLVAERAFDWRTFVGTAIGVWGMSAGEAWGLTLPEWSAGVHAWNRSQGAESDGPTKGLTWEKAREMAAEIRADKLAALQAKWRSEDAEAGPE